jgi:predicted enzyme related to lactoylglutathione lyase
MPTPDPTRPGVPVWIDLFSSDTEASRAFYGQLLGWTSESAGPEYGGYINFSKDGALVAGCMANDGSTGVPDVWSVYLASDDAEKTVAKAEAAGAAVLVPAMDVVDLGRMAVVTDAGGASVGVWQPGTHTGFGVLDEPGAPSWFELHTRDYDASVAYYRDVFGWDTHPAVDEPGFRYTTLGEGDDQAAGIMDASAWLPDGVPAHWSVYVHVADADATIAEAVALGGSVVVPAEDTPYGRLATLVDPTGATFKLRQP